MTHIATPRPWPEAQMPTAEQWRAWFLACTPDEQQHLAERVIQDAEAVTRCLVQNHADLLRELDQAHAVLRLAVRRVDRYRLAWQSARRRGRATVLIRNYLRERGLWPEDGGR